MDAEQRTKPGDTVNGIASKPQVVYQEFTSGGPLTKNLLLSRVPPHEELFQQSPRTSIPMKDSFFGSSSDEYQMSELHRFRLTSSRKPNCARETGGPNHIMRTHYGHSIFSLAGGIAT